KETTCWVERTIQMANYRLISLALTPPTSDVSGILNAPALNPPIAVISQRFGGFFVVYFR
ncbi:hypothetical protein VXO70_23295, partial [Escherichia coli]